MNDAPKQPDFDIFAEGIPAPGGSKSFIPVWNGDGTCVVRWLEPKQPGGKRRQWPVIRVIDDAGEKNTRWREVVALHAKAKLPVNFPPITRPIRVSFNFFLHRPKAHFRSNGIDLKPSAPVYPDVKPDTLKLTRSTEDALSGILWQDDALIIGQSNTKQYVKPGERPGCRIRVYIL